MSLSQQSFKGYGTNDTSSSPNSVPSSYIRINDDNQMPAPSAPPLEPNQEGYNEQVAKKYKQEMAKAFEKKFGEKYGPKIIKTAHFCEGNISDFCLALNNIITSGFIDMADKDNKLFIPTLIAFISVNVAYLFSHGVASYAEYQGTVSALKNTLEQKGVLASQDYDEINSSKAAYLQTVFSTVSLGLLCYSASQFQYSDQFYNALEFLAASMCAKVTASFLDYIQNYRMAEDIAQREITEEIHNTKAYNRMRNVGILLIFLAAGTGIFTSIKKSQPDNDNQQWTKLTYGSLITTIVAAYNLFAGPLRIAGHDLITHALNSRFGGDVDGFFRSNILGYASRVEIRDLLKELVIDGAAAGIVVLQSNKGEVGYTPLTVSILCAILFLKHYFHEKSNKNVQQIIAANSLTEKEAKEAPASDPRNNSNGLCSSFFNCVSNVKTSLFYYSTKKNTGSLCGNNTFESNPPKLRGMGMAPNPGGNDSIN